MNRAASYLAITIICVPAVALAQAQATSNSSLLSPKQELTLSATTLYCDRSLPYAYLPSRDGVSLSVQVSPGWLDYVAASYKAMDKAPGTATPPKDDTKAFQPFTADSVAPAKPSGNQPSADSPDYDPRNDSGWLFDSGDTLLTGLNITTTAPRLQRLVVRTLFGPNPFTAPCSYTYLTVPKPIANQKFSNPSGQQETVVGPGVMGTYHFSFLDPQAPDFYLINITQWKDADPPTGAPKPLPTTYYSATDKWILLNYKHPEKSQDLTKLIFRAGLEPQIVSDVPELMGKNVILLGIQLAPQTELPDGSCLDAQKSIVSPTEFAWYDAVSVQYKLHADAVTSLQMTDLGDLIQAAIAAGGGSQFEETQTEEAKSIQAFPATPDAPHQKAQCTSSTLTNISLYQGKYAAALITNIQGLPLKITSSWTASFNTAKAPDKSVDDSSLNSTVPEKAHPEPTVKSSIPKQGPSPAPDVPLSPVPGLVAQSPQQNKPVPPSKPALPAAKLSTSQAKSQSAGASTPTPPATVPTGCTPALAKDKSSQAPCTSTNAATVLDEKFSHFDFTAAVSVTGYKDLTIQSSTSSGSTVVSNTTVTRENAYGLIDLFILPEDLANPPAIGIPHFAVGLPFAGQIFDKPYFAVGETLNIPKLIGKNSKLANIPGFNLLSSDQFPLQLHPVFGYVWNKESFTMASGSIGHKRDFRPQWSVEIPFRDVANLITSFTKSSPK